MALNIDPNFPPSGDPPYAIDREWCLGDSLFFINRNFDNFDSRLISANTRIEQSQGFKNKLINAQGLINQRGYISATPTTTGNQYTVDRWRVVNLGESLLFNIANNVATFTAPAGGVEQVIEGLNLESGTYFLSWTGTATATVNGTSVTNGNSVNITGGVNTTIRFSNGTFSLPQFERYSKTNFEYRPFSVEVSLCQRYFCKTFSLNTAPASNISEGMITSHEPVTTNPNGTVHNGQGKFPVTMRAVPTITFYNPNAATAPNTVYLSSAVNDTGTIGAYGVSPERLSYFEVFATRSGGEPGGSERVCHWQFTANAEL